MIIKRSILIILISALITCLLIWQLVMIIKKEPIKVGILHSLTGPMAIYEKTAYEGALLAIEEINEDGGVLGRKLEPIVFDTKSETANFIAGAEQLIEHDKVAVVFGCWNSADRKAVRPIFEKNNNLLFYPVQHEGLEDSPNIVYTSTIPNQQAIPATIWCLENLGKKVFLVGSDEIFPRATNEILKDTIAAFSGEVIDEMYLKPGSNDVAPLIQKIKEKKPNVIINSIVGPANRTFFAELRKAGISSTKTPAMSLTVDDPDLQHYNADDIAGDYTAWSHFQSIQRKENQLFVKKTKKRYGQDYIVSDAMEAAYFGVYLWKQAAYKEQSLDINKIRIGLKNQAFNAPEGIVHIDDKSLHSWSHVSVGKIRSDKQITILWSSDKAVQPVAYPSFKSKEEWKNLLQQWYQEWGNKWSNT